VPVTVVVGGQFGSEGKGKVAHWFARNQDAVAAVRVGGSNSGHTVVDDGGTTFKFRHLPTAALLPDVTCVIGAGSYIDIDVLLSEIEVSGISDDRLIVDSSAVIVNSSHRNFETELIHRIGSTGSGTGAAVADRVLRKAELCFAKDDPRINTRFVRPANPILRSMLNRGERLVVEGTQGFGLSLLHSGYYPNVTSRDTSAAGFVAESGLSPDQPPSIGPGLLLVH
jgi:adenylosuccinate synthase